MDPGLLAELLLFYGRVRVAGDLPLMHDLVAACGPEEIQELVVSGRLKLTYIPTILSVETQDTGGPNERHRPTTISMPKYESVQDVMPVIFRSATGKSGKGMRIARRVTPYVDEYRFTSDVLYSAASDLVDAQRMSDVMAVLIAQIAPRYVMPEPVQFEVHRYDDAFARIETNIDIRAVNIMFNFDTGGTEDTWTVGQLLNQVVNAYGDLHLAALYTSELATSAITEAVIRNKGEALLAGRDHRAKQIDLFQDLTVDNGRAIREAVNSGERNFRDVIELLDAADKFRDWLSEREPTADLVKEYVERVTAQTWAQHLPMKAIRWVLMAGAGVSVGAAAGAVEGATAGAAAGVAVDGVDTFLLDRFMQGWRPNQFVDKQLRPFVRD